MFKNNYEIIKFVSILICVFFVVTFIIAIAVATPKCGKTWDALFLMLNVIGIHPNSDKDCQILGNASIVVGSVIAMLIAWLFFYFQNRFDKKLGVLENMMEGYGQIYVIRTLLLYLRDMFSAEHFDNPLGNQKSLREPRIKTTKLLDIMKREYLIRFGIPEDNIVYKIYLDAVDHMVTLDKNQTPFDHNHVMNCNECKKLFSKILSWLNDNPNIFEQKVREELAK